MECYRLLVLHVGLLLLIVTIVDLQSFCSSGCTCISHRVTCNADYGTNPLHRLPTDLPNDTLHLFVAYNEIHHLDLELYSCPNLVTLDMTSNKLMYISEDALSPLNELHTLVLAKNHISYSSVPPIIFSGKHKLEFLDLSSNRLGPTLLPNTFLYLDNLVTLLLEGNHISDIPSRALAGLKSLQVLVLRDNWLTVVPTQAWKYVPNLQELDLSNNNLSVINAGDFKGLSRVRELDLIHEVHLHTIRDFAFSDLELLEVIRVRRCRYLTVIEPNAFANIYHLKNVYLQENALTTIPGDLLQWNILSNIVLFDNPWLCNCRLQWLTEVLRMPGAIVARRNDVICDSPDYMRGDVIANIPSSSFICNDGKRLDVHVLRRVAVILFVVAASTGFLCLVSVKLFHRFQKTGDFLTSSMSYGTLRLEEGRVNPVMGPDAE